MLSVCDAKTSEDKQDLLELAGVWTRLCKIAHLRSRPEVPQKKSPRGARAAREAKVLISLAILTRQPLSKERRFLRARPDRAAPPIPPTPQPPG